jgi:hypothetical protein
MICFKIFLIKSFNLILNQWVGPEMLFHEEKDNETTKAENNGDGGEENGEKDILDPEGGEGMGYGCVISEESMDYGGIAMGEEMVDGDTVRKRSMVGVTSTEEGGGG